MSKVQELEIAAMLNYLRVPGRTEIFDFGETGDNLFIILDGVVDVIKPTEKKPKEFSLAKRISDGLKFKLDVHPRQTKTKADKKVQRNMWRKMDQLRYKFIDEINNPKKKHVNKEIDVSEES